ncbi:hypothetical protein HKX42_09465 [Salinisphaera sp. USBA-960]|uniref:hypothetical protein n=1 Tax=Salinisphaera orenii TaxID=856731 RepID=UPI000DBEA31E|nr:hypothetical protein [Salifodinibacter halophilus]NNC27101.1 hypothetical protein [Salifodinibacter halophilus]
MMRFVCELADSEHVIEADTPEEAAQIAAAREARTDQKQCLTVTVSEANEANLPLIVGGDYEVECEPNAEPRVRGRE